jgi:hypothetical protein
MEQLAIVCVTAALLVGGLGMSILPAWVVRKSRADGDARPATKGETWTIRGIGIVLTLAGCYALWAAIRMYTV